MIRFISSVLLLLSICSTGKAQEALSPLHANLNLIYPELRSSGPEPRQDPALKIQAAPSLTLPFKEDFFYAPKRSLPDQVLWSDSGVFVNAGYPRNPPSIGVATFDGLNKHGYPYDPLLISNTISRPADRLTSQPINLLTSPATQTLQVSDSVALSFYYQSTGYGDNPEISDSLALDFFSPGENKWINNIWFKRRVGNSNLAKGDTTFTRAFIWIDSAKFLMDNFRFRFRNSATTTGNFDHWHVDYIYLNKNRSMLADTILDDLTFLYVPTPLLRDYSEMPYEQYNSSEMAPKMSVKIRNNRTTAANMTYGYRIDTAASQLSSYNGNAVVLPSRSTSTYAPHANPPVNYTFAPLPDSADFKVTHFFYQTSATQDFIPRNDTVVHYQRFRNYYAFDDGSAEAGYYVNAASAKIAVKINVNVADSFLGARIYFDPIGQINQAQSNAGFRICIWSPGSNGPGVLAFRDDTILRQKYFNVDPAYSFAEFKLKNPKLLTPGTYYIGIQQLADVITIGFDRNYDHRSSIYYSTGNSWTQSSIPGSVMIRPIFGKTLPHPVGMEDLAGDLTGSLVVYPNPAADQVNVRYDGTAPLSYSMINAMGQLMGQGTITADNGLISTAHMADGIYFLTFKDSRNNVQQKKIILQH